MLTTSMVTNSHFLLFSVMRSDSSSINHVLSEEPTAFFVELVDASVLVDSEGAKDKSLEVPDARRANGDSLYRGVFWQVTTHFYP